MRAWLFAILSLNVYADVLIPVANRQGDAYLYRIYSRGGNVMLQKSKLPSASETELGNRLFDLQDPAKFSDAADYDVRFEKEFIPLEELDLSYASWANKFANQVEASVHPPDFEEILKAIGDTSGRGAYSLQGTRFPSARWGDLAYVQSTSLDLAKNAVAVFNQRGNPAGGTQTAEVARLRNQIRQARALLSSAGADTLSHDLHQAYMWGRPSGASASSWGGTTTRAELEKIAIDKAHLRGQLEIEVMKLEAELAGLEKNAGAADKIQEYRAVMRAWLLAQNAVLVLFAFQNAQALELPAPRLAEDLSQSFVARAKAVVPDLPFPSLTPDALPAVVRTQLAKYFADYHLDTFGLQGLESYSEIANVVIQPAPKPVKAKRQTSPPAESPVPAAPGTSFEDL